ncbi:hypothetical protein M0812_16410 [Anaeramoeba flamelloides]|uniref:Uncharacterized protein n=1 Tax=Anaeramoeba flamelloides TaxID=1746091 RepID=A0AAV7ZEA9_9EUKA|nr:hypothetical protein M0812_16410 [Anaeramoeba flamelloides]
MERISKSTGTVSKAPVSKSATITVLSTEPRREPIVVVSKVRKPKRSVIAIQPQKKVLKVKKTKNFPVEKETFYPTTTKETETKTSEHLEEKIKFNERSISRLEKKIETIIHQNEQTNIKLQNLVSTIQQLVLQKNKGFNF